MTQPNEPAASPAALACDPGAETEPWAAADLLNDPAGSDDDGAATEEDTAAQASAHRHPLELPRAVTEDQMVAWITAIANREEAALTALYDGTLGRVYGLALRIVRKASLAEEVAEDTYFQVWRQALRFDPSRGAAMAWLLGMARSRAIDALRREARFQHESLDLGGATIADETPATDELLAAAQSHAELHRALMLLNAQPRQLVALAFFRGLSHEEIACQTHLPLGTVKSQIRRALLALRQALGEAGLPALAS